jgi:hypothetical protein
MFTILQHQTHADSRSNMGIDAGRSASPAEGRYDKGRLLSPISQATHSDLSVQAGSLCYIARRPYRHRLDP